MATARRIAATWFLERENAAAYEGCAQIAERSGIKAILTGLDAMDSWNGIRHLQNLAAKTLVIWGDTDRTYQWSQTEQLWQSISQASLAVIPNCAHAPHLEKPEIFNSIVSDFLMARRVSGRMGCYPLPHIAGPITRIWNDRRMGRSCSPRSCAFPIDHMTDRQPRAGLRPRRSPRPWDRF